MITSKARMHRQFLLELYIDSIICYSYYNYLILLNSDKIFQFPRLIISVIDHSRDLIIVS